MDLLIIGQYFVNVLQLLNISVAAGNDGIGSRIYFVSRNDYGSWSEVSRQAGRLNSLFFVAHGSFTLPSMFRVHLRLVS
jgi:hypothetical protein